MLGLMIQLFVCTHVRASGHRLSYGITQCYLPPDTGECAPP